MIPITSLFVVVIVMCGNTFEVKLPNEDILASQSTEDFIASLKDIEDIGNDMPILTDYKKMEDEYMVKKAKRESIVPGPDLGKTSWGAWTSWGKCPAGKKVTGFRIRVEKKGSWWSDETALNGIVFSCEGGKTTPTMTARHGRWTSWKKCKGKAHVTAFDVRGVPKRSGDDYGATNVRMKCSDGAASTGDGMNKGSWVGYRECPPRTFMCGARAKIEKYRGKWSDDTALNRIQMGCCREDIYANCGKQKTARIVGGVNAKPGEWPWQVGFWMPNRKFPFCGGTLITSNVVLTAAHCFDARDTGSDTVRVGDYSMKTEGRQEEVVGVKKIVKHEKWNANTYENDIALIILDKHVKLGGEINIACLPKSEKNPEKDCFATGWGNLRENGAQPNILQEVELPIVPNAKCKESYGRDLRAGMMCAGHAEGGKDSCQGDSGGPFVCKRRDYRYEIRGVVSWGYGCANPGFYGVYANVYHFLGWIEENLPL